MRRKNEKEKMKRGGEVGGEERRKKKEERRKEKEERRKKKEERRKKKEERRRSDGQSHSI